MIFPEKLSFACEWKLDKQLITLAISRFAVV
jgi:hypothetical protein